MNSNVLARYGVTALFVLALFMFFTHRNQHYTYPARCSTNNQCLVTTDKRTFPTYGNEYPDNLGDCMFAAAANWTQIVQKRRLNVRAVEQAYLDASQSPTSGVSEDNFIWWWTSKGIAGSRVQGWNTASLMDEETVKRQVRQHRALFAIFDFRKGDTIGGQKVDPGGHATVIDGYSSAGPLVVTWGQTYQMTWGEFWRSISSLKVIEP